LERGIQDVQFVEQKTHTHPEITTLRHLARPIENSDGLYKYDSPLSILTDPLGSVRMLMDLSKANDFRDDQAPHLLKTGIQVNCTVNQLNNLTRGEGGFQ